MMDRLSRFAATHLTALVTRTACFVALQVAGVSAGRSDSGLFLKDGDRVVFCGNSIIEQRLYTTFVETFVTSRGSRVDSAAQRAGLSGGAHVPIKSAGLDSRLRFG